MKQLLLIYSLFCLVLTANAQKSYIQVSGEPGLSVYLNNQFKGKTSAELNGYIIKDVTPGNNKIKIEKDGYVPYEETVNVKAGEVFAYKVKPFAKHTVLISQEGHSGETDKKVALQTGKLVVQSLPIEISITIPQIEGVKNIAKNKDQWIADKIPVGSYAITFKFNNKTITKTIDIADDNTTTVFINMLDDEFTVKNTLSEKRAAEIAWNKQVQYVSSICAKYHVKGGLTLSEYVNQCPEARILLSYQDEVIKSMYSINESILKKKPGLLPGYTYLTIGDYDGDFAGKVDAVDYTLILTSDRAAAKAVYDRIKQEFKANIDANNLGETKQGDYEAFTISYGFNGIKVTVDFNHTYNMKDYVTRLRFGIVKLQ